MLQPPVGMHKSLSTTFGIQSAKTGVRESGDPTHKDGLKTGIISHSRFGRGEAEKKWRKTVSAHLNFHTCDTGFDHTDFLSGRPRQIYNAASDIWPAIIDANRNTFFVRQIGYPDPGPETQFQVGRGQRIPVIPLAIGCHTPMKLIRIKRGLAILNATTARRRFCLYTCRFRFPASTGNPNNENKKSD